jgi:hypothetical protein
MVQLPGRHTGVTRRVTIEALAPGRSIVKYYREFDPAVVADTFDWFESENERFKSCVVSLSPEPRSHSTPKFAHEWEEALGGWGDAPVHVDLALETPIVHSEFIVDCPNGRRPREATPESVEANLSPERFKNSSGNAKRWRERMVKEWDLYFDVCEEFADFDALIHALVCGKTRSWKTSMVGDDGIWRGGR